jgi:hypothetical protein
MKMENKTQENELLNLVLDADLGSYEKDFIVRLLDVLPDFLENVISNNYNNDIESFEMFLKQGQKTLPDIYSEIPDTDEVEDILLDSLSESKIYFYSDSDNDGKHALAMFGAFCKAHSYVPEIATISDISIKSMDPLIKNTSHHGLNSNQFIQDFANNPNEGPITIMTADNGISSQPDIDAIQEFCDDKGIEVNFIITDHHLPDPDTRSISSENVVLLDLELNPDHGRYTYSGAQTFGELLKQVSLRLTNDDLSDSHNLESIPTRRNNQLVRIIDTLGIRSAVADITHSGEVLQKEIYKSYSESSGIHNKLRGMDFFLKNIPTDSEFSLEAKEIQNIANNFLKNMNKSATVLGNNLYNSEVSSVDGGFTAIPHIQPYLLEMTVRKELKIATLDELKKLELFENHIQSRVNAFRRQVIKETKENQDNVCRFISSEVLDYKALQDKSFSTAFANQIFPPTQRNVSLTTRPVDKATGLVTGSFRSKGVKLQGLLTKDVIEKFKSQGITNPTIKGHAMAAGFKASVDPSVSNAEDIIFNIFSEEIARNLSLGNESKEKATIPVLQSSRDVLALRNIMTFLGMFGGPGDYNLNVTLANSLKNIVVAHEGKNILVGDILDGTEPSIAGYVVNNYSINGDVQIFSGLDSDNLDESVLLIGSSEFSTMHHVDEELNDYPKVPDSKLSHAITEMNNTVGEKTLADDFIKNHPLSPGPEYLDQIKNMLTVGGMDSVSELDVEASSLGKAPALTNLGIITFYISNDTGKLMMERNSVLVQTPYPIDNSNENLTEITNEILRDKGLTIEETSALFKGLFGRGNHEIRAFNGRYDLNVLMNNLDNDCVGILRNNITFTDTLRIAKSNNVGSLSSEGTIDLRDPDNQSSVIKSVRKEDYDRFMNDELDVLVTTEQKAKCIQNKRTYSINRTAKNKKLLPTKSKMSNNNVQQILSTILAKKIIPDNPFHYKIITDYKSLEYIDNNKELVSSQVGISIDELTSALGQIAKFNSNPTESQKRLMDKFGLDSVVDLFREKHNNLDEMGDIDLEGVGLAMELSTVLNNKPNASTEKVQTEINDLYDFAKTSSGIMNLSSMYPTDGGEKSFHTQQLKLLGKEDQVNKKVVEMIDISSPLVLKPKIFLKANVDLSQQDNLYIQTLVHLHLYDLVDTKEYKIILDEINNRGIMFHQFSSVKDVASLSRAIVKADTERKKDNAIKKIRALPPAISEMPEKFQDIVLLLKDSPFSTIDFALPKPLNSKDKNWKKVIKHGLWERNADAQKYLSISKVVANGIVESQHDNSTVQRKPTTKQP